ncbi:MAG: hypothetical protein VKJ46_13275 [Leptolyngbyaceae bacterium]|nr:hypothetical protein [Leptolyngbyaceae bacterium]
MYLNDIQRAKFYACLGLDAREFDIEVIRKTNETAGRVFPIILNVDHPSFFERLEKCTENNVKLGQIAASKAPKFLQFFQKLPIYISTALELAQLYFMKPISMAPLAGSVR